MYVDRPRVIPTDNLENYSVLLHWLPRAEMRKPESLLGVVGEGAGMPGLNASLSRIPNERKYLSTSHEPHVLLSSINYLAIV